MSPLRRGALWVLLAVAGLAGVWHFVTRSSLSTRPIRVGVLHSLTGTMAVSERSLVDAVRLAVEERNQAGGIAGRPIEMVVADGRSDNATFAAEAERLIRDEHVSVLFGCWTSASRKTVRPVVEREDHLLVYPLQYEGLELSPNIVYTGASPNQQILPAVKWAFDNLGHRFYLVGSDYVFPRTAHAIIRDAVGALGGEIVGERYVPLGGKDVLEVVRDVVAKAPDVILNSINGDSNVAFFDELRRGGITSAKTPTISFSIAEEELRTLPARDLAGDYAAWTYFQSIDGPENRAFIESFRARFGADRVTDDPMEAAYVGVHLWAQAVEQAGVDDPPAVREAMKGQSFAAPGGVVYVDPETQHLWKAVRIGRVRADGQFDVVWSAEHPIRPVPFPISRSPSEWTDFLARLQKEWGGGWARPPGATLTRVLP